MNVTRTVTKRVANTAGSINTYSATTSGPIADVDEDEYTELIYDSIIEDLLDKKRGTVSNGSISLPSDSYYHEDSSVCNSFASVDISMKKKSIIIVKSTDESRRNHIKGNHISSNKVGRSHKLSPAEHKNPKTSVNSISTNSSVARYSLSYVQSMSMNSSIISTSADTYVDNIDRLDTRKVGQLCFDSIGRSQSALSGYPSMDNYSISMQSSVDDAASLEGDGEMTSNQAFYMEVERCTAGIRAKLQMIDDLDVNSISFEEPTAVAAPVSELIPQPAPTGTADGSMLLQFKARDSPTYIIMHDHIDSATVLEHELSVSSSVDSMPTTSATLESRSTVEARDAAEGTDNAFSLLRVPSMATARHQSTEALHSEDASIISPTTVPQSSSSTAATDISIIATAPALSIEAKTPLPHWVGRMNSTAIYDSIADVDDSITMNSLINFKHALADIGVKDLVLNRISTINGAEEMDEVDEYGQVLSSLTNDAMRVKGLSISGNLLYGIRIS